ncbi:hypothetical protein B0O99DRAFT_265006 [Bisporella sp. PMI_857]|nr:hypothetical protein B0O99DRAFT_265006 [Bisporella sp. PMI_857]
MLRGNWEVVLPRYLLRFRLPLLAITLAFGQHQCEMPIDDPLYIVIASVSGVPSCVKGLGRRSVRFISVAPPAQSDKLTLNSFSKILDQLQEQMLCLVS